ncbi:MAG: hypothetical protein Cons2KO_10960 [Congregibacter sp.]
MHDLLLHQLSIKGFAKVDVLCESLQAERAAVDALVERLLATGVVEETRMGLRLTEQGKADVATQLQGALDAARGSAALEAFYVAFDPLNKHYKAAVADWQMREGPDGEPVINDHSDADYDAQVTRRMFENHALLLEQLSKLEAEWRLLAHYGKRLTAALARVEGGEQRYVAAPLIDSYHTVWFEFHEALIRFSGRNRADEAAAGHAV